MTGLKEIFFAEQVPQFTRLLTQLEDRARTHEQPHSTQLLQELTDSIHRSLTDCTLLERRLAGDAEQLKSAQERYREAIRPWFRQSWFMHRALTKPRGYPGDFELLTAIYDDQTKSSGLGGYLDRYFLNTTLARAVVARMKSVRKFLLDELAHRGGDVTILDVASGACREYGDGFHPPGAGRIKLLCIDNDPVALDFVRQRVAPLSSPRLEWEFARYNALRMTSVRRNRERFGRPDILYSVGLCDYIPDEYLVPMLAAWRESVAEEGAVYVAFKDADRYDKAEYQWLVDWFFFQRTAAECTALFCAAGYAAEELQCERDATGVILNFISRRPAPLQMRVDAAEALPTAPQFGPATYPQQASNIASS